MLDGIRFYGRIYALGTTLKRIGISDKNRWIFNHGIPTSMMFLCIRINSELSELDGIYQKQKTENPGAEYLELSNAASGPKNEAERRGYELYRFLQEEFFNFLVP